MNLAPLAASTSSWPATTVPAARAPGASTASARENATLASGPDVIVTLGRTLAPATYDAYGRVASMPAAADDDSDSDSDTAAGDAADVDTADAADTADTADAADAAPTVQAPDAGDDA